MDILTTFFSVPLTGFGAGMALAALTTLVFAYIWCAKKCVVYGVWIRLCVLALPLMLLGSRVLYAIGNVLYYTRTAGNVWLMLNFWEGGASVLGALLGLILAAALTERWTHAKPGVLLDAVGFGFLPGVCIERLFEKGTELGMGQTIDGGWMAEHPFFAVDDGYGYIVNAVFHYEAVVAAVLFVVLAVWMLIRRGNPGCDGDLLLGGLTLFGVCQALLESLRNDGHMLIGFVRVNQIVSIVLPVAALTVWTIRAHKGFREFDWKLLLCWILAAGGIAVATVQEFAVDSSDNVLLDYGIMAAALALVAFAAFAARNLALKRKA